jgi:transcriptional regulator with XRE-family HTH domain
VTIAKRIEAWRKWAGLSRADLADMIGVSVQTIRNWEQGTHPPTLKHLEQVAAAVEIPFEQFWIPVPSRRDVA